jgi:hypothetical protein
MSRELPPQPNLEFLRKQAKELLDTLQMQDPSAQLTDAQHRLAREYGFASWPQLKTHVELVLCPAAIVAANGNPFAGTWIVNVSRSARHPDNPFQTATLHFEIRGTDITITDVVVDESGGQTQTTNTIHADGVEYPSENGYAMTARWRSPRALEWEATKDGVAEGRGSYEVSADGRTLQLTAGERVFVFERR